MVHGPGPELARDGRPEHDPGRRRRRHAARAQGRRVREGRRRARHHRRRQRGVPGHPRPAAPQPRRRPAALHADGGRDQGRHRGDHDRRPSALRVREGRHAALPGDQRQRLGDEEQVRQQVRHAALPGRRDQPRDRRSHRRQGGRDLRLRRRRQGLRRVAARPGRPRGRHRDRPDLRAAGRDGRLPGHDARGRARDRRHLRDGHRQQGHHHGRAHGPDEAPGDRRQHRPLRQRDRHGRPGEDPRHRQDRDQAAGARVALPGDATGGPGTR